ncbi:MAG: S26 family signal peptidase [Bacteroidota bacterium]
MKNIITLIYLGMLFSCQNNSPIEAEVTDNYMAGTITIGSTISYKKNQEIKRNDIIAFKSPISQKISCLRVAGLPGEKIEIRNGILFIDKQKYQLSENTKMIYTVISKKPSNFMELRKKYEFKEYSQNYGMVKVTQNEFDEIVNAKMVDSIYKLGFDSNYIYPQMLKVSTSKKFNHFYFGPIFIPRIGDTIFAKDKMLVNNFLGFKNDYLIIKESTYFCIGDSFSDAMDSRVIGLIPQTAILGKVNLITKAKVINIHAN